MALTAAASGHTQYAIIAGIICAATVLFATTTLATTIHRDHLDHHHNPHLLNDTWQQPPAFARHRGHGTTEPHRAA
ncbi:hypothetical protein [Nocardia jejuensis]|uniref:hypothetical protein n=1 Tax=Nocardia jejuensis TaxID=328049 RepID=UPI00082B8ADB|nr:hypothetical protein [Nocardia jejuensis]